MKTGRVAWHSKAVMLTPLGEDLVFKVMTLFSVMKTLFPLVIILFFRVWDGDIGSVEHPDWSPVYESHGSHWRLQSQ